MKKLNTLSIKATKLFFTAAFLISLTSVSNFASAQNKWSLAFRPGVNFATKDLGDAKLKTGFGFEGTISYKFMPHLAAYTGWGWNKFTANNSFAGNNMDFTETGYVLGLQFVHPIATSKINFIIGAGGIYNHIETENTKGDIIADSGHGWGWQLDAGVSVPLSKRLNLIPTVRYRSLSRDIKVEGTSTAVDLNYVSVGAGLSWTF